MSKLPRNKRNQPTASQLKKRRTRQNRRQSLESLEDRVVLAAFNPLAATPDGAADSLRDAIIQSNFNQEDDIITLEAGTYALTLAGAGEDAGTTGDLDVLSDLKSSPGLTGQFIASELHIIGAGSDQTTISGGSLDRIFHVVGSDVDVYIEGVTITGGVVTGDGGGILNEAGHLNLMDVVVTENSATGDGGGVHTASFIFNSTISSNTAGGDGGGVYLSAEGSIGNSLIDKNEAGDDGGGVFASAGGVFTDNQITNNKAGLNEVDGAYGGGMYLAGYSQVGTSNIQGNSVANTNPTAAGGGGIFSNAGGDFEDLMIVDNVVDANALGRGGGLHVADGLGVYNRLTVTGNTLKVLGADPVGEGGGLYIATNATLTDSANTVDNNSVVVTGNFAAEAVGGGAFFAGDAVIDSVSFDSNTVTATSDTPLGTGSSADAGGLFIAGSASLSSVTADENTVTATVSPHTGDSAALATGGGISLSGTGSLSSVSASDNAVTATATGENSASTIAFGGGLFAESFVTISDSANSFSGNTVAANSVSGSVTGGGGLVGFAQASAKGGGLFLVQAGGLFDVAIDNNTVASDASTPLAGVADAISAGAGISSAVGDLNFNTGSLVGNTASAWAGDKNNTGTVDDFTADVDSFAVIEGGIVEVAMGNVAINAVDITGSDVSATSNTFDIAGSAKSQIEAGLIRGQLTVTLNDVNMNNNSVVALSDTRGDNEVDPGTTESRMLPRLPWSTRAWSSLP